MLGIEDDHAGTFQHFVAERVFGFHLLGFVVHPRPDHIADHPGHGEAAHDPDGDQMEIFPEFQEQAHHPVEIVDRGAHEHEAREQDHRGRSPDQRVKRLHPLRDAFEVHVFAAARPPGEAEAHEVDQQHGEHRDHNHGDQIADPRELEVRHAAGRGLGVGDADDDGAHRYRELHEDDADDEVEE